MGTHLNSEGGLTESQKIQADSLGISHEEIRKKCMCEHGNALLCKECRYNPTRFLKKWEHINTERL